MVLTPPRSDRRGYKLPQIPAGWLGSDLEWYVYQALMSLGYEPGVDFQYQYAVGGGRLEKGGAIPDFYLPGLRLGINPQGRYYHSTTSQQRGHDALQRTMLEGQGIRMEYPTEDDVLNNARETVRRCINGTYGKGPTSA